MNKEQKSYRDIMKYNQSIIHNFDVSVIMPFYKKLKAFETVLPKNASSLQRNGIEVIIVLDETTEQEGLLELIKEYPFINWKIIVNEKEHEPCNPAKVLNVGIRHACKKYVLISDPEVEFYTDVIFQLRGLLENYPRHYATGTMAFIENEDVITAENINKLQFLNYGSIMVEKECLHEIGGYYEQFKIWGGEEDNIRKRLDAGGIKKLYVPEARSLHREEKLRLVERNSKTNSFTVKELKQFYYPDIIQANGPDWGNEFSKVVYDWHDNIYAEYLCHKYLDGFIQYKIKGSDIFQNKYKKIILCQAYNESEFINGFLEDMAKYFDGIILLDDESTDNTWELAQHEKLLLKVKKKRYVFNDLENRNILLNLASFFKSEWFCFMDIDERFDERFVDFKAFEDDPKIDVVAFSYIDLWDNEEFYNIKLSGSRDGIFRRMRLFRNIGRVKIQTLKKKLHFAAIPHRINVFESVILFKHLGNLSKKLRSKKYDFYLTEDVYEDQENYNDLLNNGLLKEVSKIYVKDKEHPIFANDI